MADHRTVLRRRRALAACAAVALVAGVLVGVSTGGDDDGGERASAPPANTVVPPAGAPPEERAARDPVDRLTLRQRVGQLIVLRFDGTSPPAYAREVLRERRAAGVILFGDNVASPDQTAGAHRARCGRPVGARSSPWTRRAARSGSSRGRRRPRRRPSRRPTGPSAPTPRASATALRGLGSR